MSWFFGPSKIALASFVQPAVVIGLVAIGAALVISAIAAFRLRREANT